MTVAVGRGLTLDSCSLMLLCSGKSHTLFASIPKIIESISLVFRFGGVENNISFFGFAPIFASVAGIASVRSGCCWARNIEDASEKKMAMWFWPFIIILST